MVFVGRKSEQMTLQNEYDGTKDSLVILYGRDGIGKTRLAKEFTKDKLHAYYLGREFAKGEQNRYFLPTLQSIREAVNRLENEKLCFIIDEFDQIYKGNKEFFMMLKEFMEEKEISKKVMFILISSSIQWVEHEMVKAMGELAQRITSFVKLKEFTFLEMVHYFPDSTTEECIAISGLLGGVPKYLEYWDTFASIKDNIIRLFLSEKGRMRTEAVRFLKLDLRELSIYNTILCILAEDEYKLNYLYSRTGFSRAKISVYINNLIQLDVASKIFSFETEKRENTQKGLYGITDSFLHFWYKFMFPNLSQLHWEEQEGFYKQFIEQGLDEYMRLSFIKVCKEFLELMNQYKRLPISYKTIGSLYGKEGFIPLIARGQKGELLVGNCKWSMEPMHREEFLELIGLMEQTGRDADYYYLFSKAGFTDELAAITEGLENVTLIDLDSL